MEWTICFYFILNTLVYFLGNVFKFGCHRWTINLDNLEIIHRSFRMVKQLENFEKHDYLTVSRWWWSSLRRESLSKFVHMLRMNTNFQRNKSYSIWSQEIAQESLEVLEHIKGLWNFVGNRCKWNFWNKYWSEHQILVHINENQYYTLSSILGHYSVDIYVQYPKPVTLCLVPWILVRSRRRSESINLLIKRLTRTNGKGKEQRWLTVSSFHSQ